MKTYRAERPASSRRDTSAVVVATSGSSRSGIANLRCKFAKLDWVCAARRPLGWRRRLLKAPRAGSDRRSRIDKVFNFDGSFNRLPLASDSSSARVWSFGFNIGAQQRFRDPRPQSHAFFFNQSAAYVISDQWNTSFTMAITRRWFQAIDGINRRNPDTGTDGCRGISDPGRVVGWVRWSAMARKPGGRLRR